MRIKADYYYITSSHARLMKYDHRLPELKKLYSEWQAQQNSLLSRFLAFVWPLSNEYKLQKKLNTLLQEIITDLPQTAPKANINTHDWTPFVYKGGVGYWKYNNSPSSITFFSPKVTPATKIEITTPTKASKHCSTAVPRYFL